MKVSDLATTVTRTGLRPLYLITGDEDLLRDEALAVLRTAAARDAGGLEGFNDDLLYGDECEGGEILLRAQEIPVFASRRLIVVKTADKLPAREGEILLQYLRQPCESTTLVFVAPKLDLRLRFGKTLKETAVVVDCAPPFPNQRSAWVRAEARRLGVPLDEGALHLLEDVAAESLYRVRQELEKLAAYLPSGTAASAAHVEAVRGGLPGASVFDLIRTLRSSERARALRILARNLEAGEAPVRILGALLWQYRQVWKAKEALARGGGGEAARLLRMSPPEVTAFLSGFSDARLHRAFDLFYRADGNLKGGSAVAPALLLEALLLALCDEVDTSAEGRRPGTGTPARQVPARPTRGTPGARPRVSSWKTSGR